VIAGFSLQQILPYRLSSSLPHCIHHQGTDCWFEATLQRIASSLLQEQCHNNGGLLSSNPPGLVTVLFWDGRGVSTCLLTLVFLGKLGIVLQREDRQTCRWWMSQCAVMCETGGEGEMQHR